MKLRNCCLLALVLLLAACTKAPKTDTPEGALNAYVNAAFAVKGPGDRQKLIDLSTGDARGFLERMTDEDFRKQFIDSNLRFVSVDTKDMREENSGDVSLVYELSYREGSNTSPTVHTNKKIAYLTKDAEGHWRIRATKNVKSFVEMKEELVVTPETTERDGSGDGK